MPAGLQKLWTTTLTCTNGAPSFVMKQQRSDPPELISSSANAARSRLHKHKTSVTRGILIRLFVLIRAMAALGLLSHMYSVSGEETQEVRRGRLKILIQSIVREGVGCTVAPTTVWDKESTGGTAVLNRAEMSVSSSQPFWYYSHNLFSNSHKNNAESMEGESVLNSA